MPKTKIIKINKNKPERDLIKKAATILKKGGIVAFPTDTVYGIGVNALSQKAVATIYEVKKRTGNKPLIILIGRKKDACKYVHFSAIAEKCTLKFWPGKLTIVGKLKNKTLSHLAKNNTIGVRMPSNKIFVALARSCKFPLATTSANLSREASATSAQEVAEELGEMIDLIIDGGRTKTDLASTILDLTSKTPKIIRRGKITLEEIKKTLL